MAERGGWRVCTCVFNFQKKVLWNTWMAPYVLRYTSSTTVLQLLNNYITTPWVFILHHNTTPQSLQTPQHFHYNSSTITLQLLNHHITTPQSLHYNSSTFSLQLLNHYITTPQSLHYNSSTLSLQLLNHIITHPQALHNRSTTLTLHVVKHEWTTACNSNIDSRAHAKKNVWCTTTWKETARKTENQVERLV